MPYTSQWTRWRDSIRETSYLIARARPPYPRYPLGLEDLELYLIPGFLHLCQTEGKPIRH